MIDLDKMIEAAPRLTAPWLAGFFDGEGHVSIYKQSNLPVLQVGITQTNFNLLMLISLKFNHDGQVKENSKSKLTKRECYTLRFSGSKCIHFLEYIKDHVIAKRDQIELALQMAYLIRDNVYTNKTSTEHRLKREELYNKLRAIRESSDQYMGVE